MRGLNSLLGALLLGLSLVHGNPVYAEAGDLLRVDATTPTPAVVPAVYHGGTNHTPDGMVLGVTDQYLTLAGKPWIPVMGEMHFVRVPEADWDADLARMKAAGVDVVSTYIIWIYHEEEQGQWDWSGNRDLRHFAELCQKHGLLLMVRIGPWAHAETRHGGLPDWVMAAGPVREMDPKFMAETKAFYEQIGMQLRGLLWKEGGPVMGVQIENEYSERGPGKGAEYLLALKTLARKAGLDVPLYTVTGWDNAVVPAGEFLPVFGGYPAAPWGGTTAKLPPQEVYAFRFGSRVSGNMGMIGAKQLHNGEGDSSDAQATPFLTAEVGGGIEDTYHRRPVIQADDIVAMAPVMLGSGVNGYGTYMMVGGQDALGKFSTFQESQSTGYPTDVPVRSYDFQAPIGEFGRERQSLRLLKEWNYFMQDFGALLAPMPAFAPAIRPRDPADLSVLRWSVRSNGSAGFVFVNNYVRGVAMPARPKVQFAVALPQGHSAVIPGEPIDIPSGSFFAWPFGLKLGGGVELRYATAQLMALLPGDQEQTSTHVFFCLRDVRCELSIEGTRLKIDAPDGISVKNGPDAALLTRGPKAGDLSVITVSDGSTQGFTRFILLGPLAAEDTWKLPFESSTRLVLTKADIWAEGGGLALAQLGNPVFHFAFYPPAKTVPAATASVKTDPDGGFTVDVPQTGVEASLQEERKAATTPPVHLGPPLPWRPIGVAQTPDEQVWTAAAGQWRVRISPEQIPDGVSNVFLRVQYIGDAGRLTGPKGELLEDNFWNGEPWLVGLRRFENAEGALPSLDLSLLPIRADAPVYLADKARAELPAHGQRVELKSVEAIPEYLVRISPKSQDGKTSK